MSMCSRPEAELPLPGPAAAVYSTVTRSWLMRRVLSGHSRRIARRARPDAPRRQSAAPCRRAAARDRRASSRPSAMAREVGQPPARDETAHQRGDEHGLAGAREPRDAEPDGRGDEIGGVIAGAAQGIGRGSWLVRRLASLLVLFRSRRSFGCRETPINMAIESAWRTKFLQSDGSAQRRPPPPPWRGEI